MRSSVGRSELLQRSGRVAGRLGATISVAKLLQHEGNDAPVQPQKATAAGFSFSSQSQRDEVRRLPGSSLEGCWAMLRRLAGMPLVFGVVVLSSSRNSSSQQA